MNLWIHLWVCASSFWTFIIMRSTWVQPGWPYSSASEAIIRGYKDDDPLAPVSSSTEEEELARAWFGSHTSWENAGYFFFKSGEEHKLSSRQHVLIGLFCHDGAMLSCFFRAFLLPKFSVIMIVRSHFQQVLKAEDVIVRFPMFYSIV